MLRIKLFAILSVLSLVGIVFLSSHNFSSEAKEDVLKDIAGYKTWKRLVKPEPKIEVAKIEVTTVEIAKIEPGTFQISDSSIAG